MAQILPVRDLLATHVPENRVVLIDSGVLFNLCDLDHPQYRARIRNFEALVQRTGIQFRFLLATRLFARDILRRKFLTEFLRTHVQRQTGHRSSIAALDEFIRTCLARCQTDASGQSLLSDADISAIRDKCFHSFSNLEEGIRQWQFICQVALGKKLEIVSERIAAMKIRYIGLEELGVHASGPQPQWRKQEELMLQYGLNSSDTALVSLLGATDQIFGLISNEKDLISLLQLRGHFKDLRCYTFASAKSSSFEIDDRDAA